MINIFKIAKEKIRKKFLKADDEEYENEEPDLEPYDFDSSTDLGENDDDPNSDLDNYDFETYNDNFFDDEGEDKEGTKSGTGDDNGNFDDKEETESSEDDEEPDDEDEEWASQEKSNGTQLEDSDGTKSTVNQESNETQPDETAQQEIFELANQEKFIEEFEKQFPIVAPKGKKDKKNKVNFSKLVSVYNYEGQEIKKREDGSLLVRLGLEVDDKRSFLNAINKVEKVKQLLDEKFDNRIEEQKNVVDEKQKFIDQNKKRLDDAKKLDLSKATIKSIEKAIKLSKEAHKKAVEVYNAVVKQVKSYKKIIEKQYKEYVKPAEDSSSIDDFNSVEKRLVDFCLALGISPTIISKIQVPSLPGSFTWYKFEATNAEEKLKQRNLTKDTSLLNIIDALEKLDISGDDQFKELIREARIAAGDIGMSIAIIRQAVSADEKKIDEYCLNPKKLQVEINNRLAEVCAGGDIKNPIVVPEVLEHIKLQLDFEKRLEKNAEEGWSTKKSKKEGDQDQEDKERWKFPAEFLFKIELCHFILSEAKDDNKVDKIYKDLAKKADERNIFEQLKQSKSNDKVGENYESMFEQLEDLFESFRGSDIKNYQTKISRDLGSKGEKEFWTRLNKTGIIKSEADHKLKSEYMFPSDGKVQEELDEIQDSFRASATQAAKNTQQKASSTIDSAITTPKETQPSETSKGKKRDEDEKKAEEKQEKYKNMYRKELLGKLYPTYFAEKRYIDLVDTYCFRYLTKYRNQLEKELSNNPDNQTNESSLSDSDKLKIMGLICLMAKPKETPGETKIIDSISGETEDEGEDQEEEEEGNSEASKNEAQQNGGNDNPPPIVSDYNPPELKSDHEPPELKSDHEPPELKSDHEPPELKSDHEPPELKSDHEPPELKSDYEYPKIISDYMSKAILNSYRDGTSIKGEDLKFISSFLNVPPKDLATSPVYLKFLILSKTFNLTPKFWIQFMKNKKVDLNLFMDVFSEYFTAYEVFPNQEDNPHSNEIKDLKNTLSENQKSSEIMKSNENQSNDNQNISNENVKSDVGDKYNVDNIDDINFNDFNEVQECWRYLRAKYRIIIMCIAKNTKVMSGKQANLVQQAQKKIEEGDERFLSKNFRNSNAKVLISNAKLFFKNLTNSLHVLEEDGDIKQYLGTRYLNAIKDRQSMIKENSGSDAIITDDNWKIKL